MFNEKARITYEINIHGLQVERNEAGGGSGMKRKIKVTAVKWIELDVEAGHRQPFDNYEDELSEAAIDMVIDQIQRFDVDDIEWDAEVMEEAE